MGFLVSIHDFFASHGLELLGALFGLMGAVKVIVRLTPTLKDDAIFSKIDKVFEAVIPNYEKQRDGE